MNNMKIGYIRVSTEEQREDRQVDLLLPICDEIHVEKRSAVGQSRPVFEAVLDKLNAGDTLVVWSLDRAFRSARDALNIEAQLKDREVALRIVSLGVDTATADGKLAFTMVAAVAEHERARLSERTKQGLAVARKNGKHLGQKPKMTPEQAREAAQRLADGEMVKDVAWTYRVHPQTLRRHIDKLPT
ncbi:recombinase family protein [Cognatishimia sp. WU-CL00825]|uniref:recombinase family protein n=1 Tax=Cognatishimia sp. WU-CL00825 TaxID=3127658 RepID=UPI0033659129